MRDLLLRAASRRDAIPVKALGMSVFRIPGMGDWMSDVIAEYSNVDL